MSRDHSTVPVLREEDVPRTMSRLPSLTAVRYFSVAARTLSFTAAANELHVTQGAVSRMVQSLESDLGVQLFERNGRWITLSPAGQAYYREVSEALDRIANASEALRQAAQEQALSIAVNDGLATLWLVPKLHDFQRRHPQVRIEILPNDARPASGVAIRYGSPPWTGLVADRLPLFDSLGVVCAPQRRAEGCVQRPDDLARQPLLAFSGGKRDYWLDYFEALDLPPPDLSKAMRIAQILMLREAAIAGLGYALVPLFLVEADLDAGRLVQVLPQTVKPAHGYYLTYPKGAETDAKFKAFSGWLMEASRSSQEAPARRAAQAPSNAA
jgi:LysR family glycine cleavage system transcriptional activator